MILKFYREFIFIFTLTFTYFYGFHIYILMWKIIECILDYTYLSLEEKYLLTGKMVIENSALEETQSPD